MKRRRYSRSQWQQALTANVVEKAEDYRWVSLHNWLGGDSPILPRWVERVNETLIEKEFKAIRHSVSRGKPFGDEKSLV